MEAPRSCIVFNGSCPFLLQPLLATSRESMKNLCSKLTINAKQLSQLWLLEFNAKELIGWDVPLDQYMRYASNELAPPDKIRWDSKPVYSEAECVVIENAYCALQFYNMFMFYSHTAHENFLSGDVELHERNASRASRELQGLKSFLKTC